MVDNVNQGKKNRRSGLEFERKFREVMEKRGYILVKWANNVSLIQSRCVPAKPGKFRMMQTGFPDFLMFWAVTEEGKISEGVKYQIHMVECKTNGRTSPEEDRKAQWYLKHNYCNKFFVASKEMKNNKIEIHFREIKREDKA